MIFTDLREGIILNQINQMMLHILPLSFETWLPILNKRIPERPHYKKEQGTVHIGQVAARFLVFRLMRMNIIIDCMIMYIRKYPEYY